MPNEQTVLRSYEEAYVVCRALRSHSWEVDERTKKKKGGIGFHVVVLACKRCNMGRIDTFNWSFSDLIARTYRPPAGYKLDFKPSMMNLRREMFLREGRG
jgi:hypothetical protein